MYVYAVAYHDGLEEEKKEKKNEPQNNWLNWKNPDNTQLTLHNAMNYNTNKKTEIIMKKKSDHQQMIGFNASMYVKSVKSTHHTYSKVKRSGIHKPILFFFSTYILVIYTAIKLVFTANKNQLRFLLYAIVFIIIIIIMMFDLNKEWSVVCRDRLSVNENTEQKSMKIS